MAYPCGIKCTSLRSLSVCIILTFAGVSTSRGQAGPPLSAYNVDPNTVTVAGVSAGGFMAVQLQVAYSKRIFGTAIFAGGPYHCAQDSVSNALPPLGYCTSGNGIPLQALIDYTNSQAASGTIDPTSNIAGKPISRLRLIPLSQVDLDVVGGRFRG
jgi:hypothetical protein